MVTASAPGKVYLFGEHAVVFGEPAVPCAIERRARVSVSARDDDHIRVQAHDLSLDGFTVEYTGSTVERPNIDVSPDLVEAAMGYIEEAVEQARDAASEPTRGFDIDVESDIPLGAGLGSSAAVVVAVIDAATRELGVSLPRTELAERAYQAESQVQHGEASRADTFCSTMGGAVRVEEEDTHQLGTPNLPLVIGFDGGAGDTAELVAAVRSMRDRFQFAAETIQTIGDVVRQGEQMLGQTSSDTAHKQAKLSEIGELMNFNHGLLSALGVSTRSLDAMVWAAREAGAYGAKLTGAGGGGCIVAVDPTAETQRALEYTAACVETFSAELDDDGVRVEES